MNPIQIPASRLNIERDCCACTLECVVMKRILFNGRHVLQLMLEQQFHAGYSCLGQLNIRLFT